MTTPIELVHAELKRQGYFKATADIPKPKHNMCHVVYLVKDKPGFYEASSRSANSVALKLRRYFDTGNINCLPIAVRRWVESTDLEVEIWVLRNKFINWDIGPVLLSNGFKEMQRKERDRDGLRKVYKLQLKGIPGIKLVTSIATINHVRSSFLTQARDAINRTHKSEVPEYREWCVKNNHLLEHANLDCDIIAEDLSKEEAIEFVRKYEPSAEEGFVMGRV